MIHFCFFPYSDYGDMNLFFFFSFKICSVSQQLDYNKDLRHCRTYYRISLGVAVTTLPIPISNDYLTIIQQAVSHMNLLMWLLIENR